MDKNNLKKPLISVLMSVFNGSLYIEKALASILNQSLKDFELLIVDDASTDSTWSIIQQFQKRYPKQIRIFKLTRNCGAFAAANLALKYTKAKFIAIMDSDDIADPHRFAKQIDFLRANPDVIVVGSQVKLIDEDDKLIGQKRLPLAHEQIYRQFALVHPMVHPSCMIRRSLLPNPKVLYKVCFGVSDDYYTLFTLLNYGKFANLDECLLSYRIHLKNSSLTNLKDKFLTTYKIRRLVSKSYGYKMGFSDQLLMLFQALIVFITPAKYLFGIYMLCRKLYPASGFYKITYPKIKTLFLRQINLRYLFSD